MNISNIRNFQFDDALLIGNNACNAINKPSDFLLNDVMYNNKEYAEHVCTAATGSHNDESSISEPTNSGTTAIIKKIWWLIIVIIMIIAFDMGNHGN